MAVGKVSHGVPFPAPEDPAIGVGRQPCLDRFREVRALSMALSAPLGAEDQQVQSMDDVSPTKWHLGHVTWFFETFLLGPHLDGYEVFEPAFGYLFNSYYEAIGPRHARHRRGLLTRPPLDRVHAYRAHVDEAMIRLIETAPEPLWDSLAGFVVLGLHHEQQHQELMLTDIKHVLASQPLLPAYRPDLPQPSPGKSPDPAPFMTFEGGMHWIGAKDEAFHFDNETPCHQVHLDPFSLASRPVANGELRAFIEEGGYREPSLWLADGWAWVRSGGANLFGAEAPMYWRPGEGGWEEFTLGGLRPLDEAAPAAHLSFYEADALARWMGARLPTEAEWESAARDPRVLGLEEGPDGPNCLHRGWLHPVGRDRQAAWDAGEVPSPAVPPGPARRSGPQAVQAALMPPMASRTPPSHPDSSSASPCALFGDVWEWTASAYAPYPGFRASSDAIGEYNGKFMINQMVLRGGSCVTPPGHLRDSYRNFFYPHQSWQFSGLRLARDA